MIAVTVDNMDTNVVDIENPPADNFLLHRVLFLCHNLTVIEILYLAVHSAYLSLAGSLCRLPETDCRMNNWTHLS